ncbi:hypothetical protein [Streptomyces sp. 1222.5]|uniref:hypothetical protein n=1 Tax=Streptomyces sp. 1222.5 TaxID=1881026 RepID=UPI003D738629
MKRPVLRAARATAVCATAAAVLTGCGVQRTGVVEAGGPATIAVSSSPGQRMLLLYFVSPRGRVTPVTRMLAGGDDADPSPQPVSGAKALAALFDGPRGNETAAGLHTELPRFRGDLQVKADTDTVTIHLPIATARLTTTALRQIVCTAAYAEGGGSATVTIWGEDGGLPSARC